MGAQLHKQANNTTQKKENNEEGVTDTHAILHDNHYTHIEFRRKGAG